MTTTDDLAVLRTVWQQAHANEVTAFDIAALAPTAPKLLTVRDAIANDITAITGRITAIAAAIPAVPPARSITAKVSTDANGGRVDLQEVGFVASDRRRDGGSPNAGDSGWTGAIVGGVAPGRDLTFLHPSTTYVVGMRDKTKGDWISTTVKIPGTVVVPPPTTTPGGIASLLAALGASNGGGNDQPSYRHTTEQHWHNMTGKTVPPIRYCYVEADPENTGLLESVMSFWTTDPDVIAGRVRPHIRLSMGNSQNPCSAVKNGSLSVGMRATGAQLERIRKASGIAPPVALAWEWDGWWYSWSCGGIGGRAEVWEGSPATMHVVFNTVPDFISAMRRSIIDLKTTCPAALIYLNGGVGCGGGEAHNRTPDMSLAEQVMQGLSGVISGTGTAADGQKWIDGFGGDLYNDGWPGNTSNDRLAGLLLVLAANKAFIEKWKLPWGMQELGVADAIHDSLRIDTADFMHAVLHWMASLSALHHFLVFDFGEPVGDYSGWRGFSWVVNEGQTAVVALLAELGV